jgi:hypothetical protein
MCAQTRRGDPAGGWCAAALVKVICTRRYLLTYWPRNVSSTTHLTWLDFVPGGAAEQRAPPTGKMVRHARSRHHLHAQGGTIPRQVTTQGAVYVQTGHRPRSGVEE